jgi:hypothetical protein
LFRSTLKDKPALYFPVLDNDGDFEAGKRRMEDRDFPVVIGCNLEAGVFLPAAWNRDPNHSLRRRVYAG